MKTNLSKRFGTDSDKEEAGVWANFGDGIRVRIRRYKSRYVADARRELEKPFAAEIRRGPLPDDVAEELAVKHIAKAVIADWEGILDENDQAIPATYENKLAVLKALPEFRDEIIQIALSRDAYVETNAEDAEGN